MQEQRYMLLRLVDIQGNTEWMYLLYQTSNTHYITTTNAAAFADNTCCYTTVTFFVSYYSEIYRKITALINLQ